MKKTSIILLICILTTLFISCNSHDDILPLLNIQGANMQHTQNNYEYYGNISAEGADLLVEADKIIGLSINKVVTLEENEQGQSNLQLKGEWGEIKTLSESNQTKVSIHINKNISTIERLFVIKLKKGNLQYKLTLNQTKIYE